MKKGYVLLVILIILVFMAGCGNRQVQSNGSGKSPAGQTGEGASTSSGGSSGGTSDGQMETGMDESKGAEVIVKSGSDVASKDKAELLNQIDRELDQMINDMNNLEDISDSDLQY